MTRTVAVLSIVATGLAVAPTVNALTPTNDDIGSATSVVEPLPYQDVVVTTGATGAADDPGCVADAGDPANPTVWYSYTPSADVSIQADTFGSNYDTTLSAYVDDGGLIQIGCNDDTFGLQSALQLELTAGVQVLFMVGKFAGIPFGPGEVGELVFNVGPPPPPLELTVTVNPNGRFTPQTGVATISGSVTCSTPAFVELFAQLDQRVGRSIINGFGFVFFEECDGEMPFTMEIRGENGLFAGGRANIRIDAAGFAPGGEVFTTVEETIRLRSGRP